MSAASAPIVRAMEPVTREPGVGEESARWLRELRDGGPQNRDAV